MKDILKFISNDKKPILAGIILGVISGLLSFSFLAFFNFMIGIIIMENYNEVNRNYILVFVVIVLLFIWSRRAMSFTFIKYSQRLFWKLRMELLSIILKSNYTELDKRRPEIHSALIHDIGTLTQASLNIIHFITSSVVLISCLAYMYYLSGVLFLITIITCVLGILVYLLGSRKSDVLFIQTRDLEDGFMKNFNAILNGFREIHMDNKKGLGIVAKNIEPISQRSFSNNTNAFVGFLNNQITGQILFYILIASILLVFSVKLEIEGIIIVNFLFILLYVLGALEGIMVLIPSLVQARISFMRLTKLKEDLNASVVEFNVQNNEFNVQSFENIKISEIEFTYQLDNTENFQIGPISFILDKGDIVFIYGGNGSGKTTFIHSLLGLLKPDKGSIAFNNISLNESTYSSYKSMFAVVFNDYYLFDEFYGNENFDQQKAKDYLTLFEIEEKVQVIENGFSTVDLSTGQRKRLALIAALLENKPIIVMDEWAADQDPYFRKKFYTEILSILKQDGFTILAITHDDVYYSYCDKLLKMEDGKLKNETNIEIQDKLILNE